MALGEGSQGRPAGRPTRGGRSGVPPPRYRQKKPLQRTLGDFFPALTAPLRAKAVQGDFNEEKRRHIAKRKVEEERWGRATRMDRDPMHCEDQTFSCLTQNVNGFGADDVHRNEWFRALKKQDAHGRHDVVFLQETHVEALDVKFMEGQHARTWGFRVGPGCPTLSFWSPSEEKRGGVAMLIDPYGRLKDPQPAMVQHWSPHFMAITGTHDGTAITYVCIYAPHRPGIREAFYRTLAEITLPPLARMIIGGDFNCTLNPRVDRSHFRRHSTHESVGLAALQTSWGLMDAILLPDNESDDHSLRDFYNTQHTYRYTLPSGETATARLDRWYITVNMQAWIAGVEVHHPGARADHQAVRLHLINPQDHIRMRRPTRVYPPPNIAAPQVKTYVETQLGGFRKTVLGQATDAGVLATEWVALKTSIRTEALRIIKQRRKTARSSYRQKCRRLRRQEQRILEAQAGVALSVAMITDMMAAMTLREGKGHTPLERVRAAITDCVRGRLALRQRQLFQRTGYRKGATSKAFFRRVSNKYGDAEIHRLDAANGHQERGVHAKPDTIADAWTHIFQQESCSEEARQAVLCWLGTPGQYSEDLADLMEPITEDEVAKAIRTAKPGKACGPDRLGNDFYRDFAECLTPILTVLYNGWYNAGVMPNSFLEADIFCLKKGGGPTDPLNFRPLSLMDTDYKLLTRILTSRTCVKLPGIIHPNQNGFVPMRTIHATIDLFYAAQAMAQLDPAFAAALALLLDFCKAYDSVDREFLYAVLLWLGFPPAFVAAIRAMHDGTRVRFLANGYRSRWVTVTCGIRQGCPLAPLLFLLVLEALYRRLDNHPDLKGIEIRSAGGRIPLRVAGYADDSASYVKSAAEIPIVLTITRLFALASGLKLNEGKTLVIALNPHEAARGVELPSPLRLQEAGQLARYLGVQVGSTSDAQYTWDLAHRQLVIRLTLAAQKTTTTDQRSTLVAAIVILKLLYIGRHQWPTADTVTQFQRMIYNFVWHSRFTAEKQPGRAWMSTDVAALPRVHGGLAVPDLRTELLALAAATVAQWAVQAPFGAQVVVDVIADVSGKKTPQALHVTPGMHQQRSTAHLLGANLWQSGARVCEAHGGHVPLEDKPRMVAALGCLLYFVDGADPVWYGRKMTLELTGLTGAVSRQYTAAETRRHGVFCREWIPYMALKALRLHTPEGPLVNPSTHFRALCAAGLLVKDVVHWTWTSKHRLQVTALTEHLTFGIRRQLGQLVRLLLLNFPMLLHQGNHDGSVRYMVDAIDHDPIHRVVTVDRRLCAEVDYEDPSQEGTPIRTHEDLRRAMVAEVGTTSSVDVHPHPRLARMACLWAGLRRWRFTRAHFKRKISSGSRRKGTTKRDQAQRKWDNSAWKQLTDWNCCNGGGSDGWWG